MSRGSTTSSCWPGVSNDVYPLYELMEQGGGASSCSVPCWDLFTLLLRIMYEEWPNALDWRAAPSRAAGVFTVQCMTRSRIRTRSRIWSRIRPKIFFEENQITELGLIWVHMLRCGFRLRLDGALWLRITFQVHLIPKKLMGGMKICLNPKIHKQVKNLRELTKVFHDVLVSEYIIAEIPTLLEKYRESHDKQEIGPIHRSAHVFEVCIGLVKLRWPGLSCISHIRFPFPAPGGPLPGFCSWMVSTPPWILAGWFSAGFH